MHVSLTTKEVLAVHGNGLETILMLIVQVLHLLHVHSNLHPVIGTCRARDINSDVAHLSVTTST